MVRTLVGLLAVTALGAGCNASAPPARPPGLPPTPATITVKNPGGDASDPEQAALLRLAAEPWGSRRDRWASLRVPLVDARHWARVTLWGYPTRAAFRFGDEHYGVVAIWYQLTPGSDDPDACLARFLSEAQPAAEGYGVHVEASRRVRLNQVGPALKPMVVQVIDATVDSLFDATGYAGALAAYQSWPGTCLVQGFVVRAGKHRELAAKVRDRWVAEGAARLVWDRRLLAAPPPEAR